MTKPAPAFPPQPPLTSTKDLREIAQHLRSEECPLEYSIAEAWSLHLEELADYYDARG